MALLDAKIQSPEELFAHKLGAALTMENTILEMLEKLQQEVQDSQLERDLRQHHEETQRHVQNLQRCFHALGEPIDEKPCPAIEGLEKEGEQMIGQVSDDLVAIGADLGSEGFQLGPMGTALGPVDVEFPPHIVVHLCSGNGTSAPCSRTKGATIAAVRAQRVNSGGAAEAAPLVTHPTRR